MRRIVQIAEGMDGRANEMGGYIESSTTALCDDGSLWILLLDHDDKGKPFQAWKRLPDIPQGEVEA